MSVARAQLAEAAAPPRPSTIQPLVAAADEALVAVRNAQTTVGDERVTAPLAGTIVSVGAVDHQRVASGTVVAVLESRTLTIQAALAQQDLPAIRIGQPAVVTVPGAPAPLRAKVTAVAAASSPGATNFPVTLAVSSDPGWLRPGEVVAAAITTRSDPAAILIPAAAIVSLGGAPQVFVVGHAKPKANTHGTGRAKHHAKRHRTGHAKRHGTGHAALGRRATHPARTGRARGSGRARLVGIHVGITDGTTAMVTGLVPGDEVVTLGQTYLARGEKVSVVHTVPVPGSVTGSTVGGLIAATTVPPNSGRAAGRAAGTSGRGGGRGVRGG